MTPTTPKLKEIYADLWGPYNLSLLLRKTYIGLLFDKFIYKSWVLLLQSKDEFFNTFKLWLPYAKACGEKLECLQTNSRREFINTAF